MRYGIPILIGSIAVLVASVAYAQQIVPAATGAMGGAGVAGGNGADAAFFNPAALAPTPDYVIDLGANVSLDGKHYPLAAGIYDSATNRYACTYLGFQFLDEPNERQYDFLLEFGIPIVEETFFIGLGGKWHLVDTGDGFEHRLGLDLGMLIKPGAGFSLGVAARNAAEYQLALGRDLAAGLAWSTEFLLVAAEYRFYYQAPNTEDEFAHSAAAGVEVRIDWVRLRVGYSFLSKDNLHTPSAGIGLRGLAWELSVSYSVHLPQDADSFDTEANSTLMFNLRLHLPEAEQQNQQSGGGKFY